jgi:hypothetical protein
VKILKQGVPPGEQLWRGDCRKCGSKMEAKQAELTRTDGDRDGPIGFANCPVCAAEFCLYPVKEGK